MIDGMVDSVGAMKQKTGDYDDGQCTEFMRARKFIQYFQENAGQQPMSLFFKQLSDEQSAFRLMLGMNNIFLVQHEAEALYSARSRRSEVPLTGSLPKIGSNIVISENSPSPWLVKCFDSFSMAMFFRN